MLVAVDQDAGLEPDRNVEPASRRRRRDPRATGGIEDDDPRLRIVLPRHELLSGKSCAVLRPEQRARLDAPGLYQHLAVEDEPAVLRAAHPRLLGISDARAQSPRQVGP
jgi:hypothetical protein